MTITAGMEPRLVPLRAQSKQMEKFDELPIEELMTENSILCLADG
jgi:hypothetical protein